MPEITITLDVDDAGPVAVALREQSAKWRKVANSQTNISDVVARACDRLDRIAERIEREMNNA
jgi:hypothetical protein